MKWLDKLLGKSQEVVVAENSFVPTEPALSVFDYPKSEYKVYWEIHLYQQADYWVADINFIGYHGTPIRETHTVMGATPEKAEEGAQKLIREKMDNFKR